MVSPFVVQTLFVSCSRDANHAAAVFAQQRRPPIVSSAPALGKIYQVTPTANAAWSRGGTRFAPQRSGSKKRIAQGGDNAMNQDVLTGKWKQMRGQVKQWWGKLTDDDLDRIDGAMDKLAGALQERYGWERDQAEREMKKRFDRYDDELRDPSRR